MKRYEVVMDYVMTATIVVEARNEESACNKAGRFVHTRRGFDEYLKVAAHRNVMWNDPSCCGNDGFDIPFEPIEFDGEIGDGHIEI